MTVPLNVLIVEDNPADAEIMAAELRRAGYAPSWRRVDTEADYLAALTPPPELILSDHALPGFSGRRALTAVRERGLDTPFILVSGTIGEEAAVDALHHGAADYIIKDRIARLGPAARQALEQQRLQADVGRAAAALKASQSMMAALLDSMMDAVVTVDADQRILFFNPAAEAAFRCRAADVVGRTIDRFIPENHRAKHADHIRAFAASGVTHRRLGGERGEITVLRADGERFPAEASVSQMEVDGKKLYTAILRDVTERKKLEEQFRQAQKMEAFGRLAGGVAHDFNNLLTVINGFSELLLAQIPAADARSEAVRQIKDAGDRAAALTRQLLAFSRKQILQPVVLDLNALLTESAKLLRRLIGEDIRLTVIPGAELWPVKADPGQLSQVLMNLAVNARDAMPGGGALTLQTANVELNGQSACGGRGPHVRLTVTDSGCGMDTATRRRIFEPFFTTKEPGRGTGLGLATVLGIVQQSDGHIEVETEPGRGTTFRIDLPRAEAPVRPAPLSGSQPNRPPGKATVLLVEDEAGARQLVRMLLEMAGCTVLEAGDGEEAVRVSRDHPGEIQVLLSDTVLPGENGPQVARRLRAARPGLRVVFMSGYTEDEVVRRGVIEGMAFLQKPFGREALIRKLREVLAD